jgi:poly(3-hydroxybutyrate) depolymerase
VVPSNADSIVLQWTHLHGLDSEPDRTDRIDGHPRRSWLGPDGEPAIEQYSIAGMAHGVPLDGEGEDRLGSAGAHMLDVGLSSTARIAAFFGITPEEEARPAARRRRAEARPPKPAGPQAAIEKALRAAGLLK